MKNSTIRERYAAIANLSNRVLPSPTAINKVAFLLARFKPLYEVTEEGRNKLIQQYPVPADWDNPVLPAAIAEARQKAMDELMAAGQPVKKVPEQLRITEADLPKALKREGGESNAEGLAGIIAMLGSLYQPSKEALALNVQTEGEEPDEASYEAEGDSTE